MIEFFIVMAGIYLIYLMSKFNRRNEEEAFEVLANAVGSMMFVEIEQVLYQDQTIYLAFDIYSKKFLGQADNCAQLYNHIFESKDTAEVIWAKLKPTDDTLIRIDRSLVTESIADLS